MGSFIDTIRDWKHITWAHRAQVFTHETVVKVGAKKLSFPEREETSSLLLW